MKLTSDKKLLTGIITALIVTTPPATAFQYEGITINGFASVTGGITSDEQTFRATRYTDNFEFKPESKFALQVIADLGEGLSATAQVMAKGQNDFNAEFEWAYLSYELTDSTIVRAGRLRIPFYKYSDYLDVGYAQTFIRPSLAMYSIPFSTYDGLSLLQSFSLGSFDFSANFTAGNVNDEFFTTTEPTVSKLESVYGINLQVSREWFSAYAAYFTSKADIPRASINNFADQLESNGAPTSATSLLRIDGDNGTFVGLGFGIDYNNIIINGEYSIVDVDEALFLKDTQWYVMAGYRIGKFTPYAMYEAFETESDTSTAKRFPAQLQSTVQAAYNSQQFEFTGMSAGIRYDFHPSAALKLEYNHYDDIIDLTSGLGTPSNPESLDVLSVSVDVVF